MTTATKQTKPTKSPLRVDGVLQSDAYIDDIFGSSGALSAALPNYVKREGQVELAKAIHDAFNRETALLAEGPCGVGKSVAYLIPAIHYAVTHRCRVLVVTANKALQEQLIEKDLPMLREALKGTLPAFRFALAKGRSNYLCKRDFALRDRVAADVWAPDYAKPVNTVPSQGTYVNVSSPAAARTSFVSWPKGIPQQEIDALGAFALATETGDRSDVGYAVPDALWRAASVSPDDCDRRACLYFKSCFAERSTYGIQDAHIVVANYDLAFYKMIYSGEESWRQFAAIIMDEAHEAPQIARRCFGHETTQWAIKRITRTLRDRLNESGLAKELSNAASHFFKDVAEYASKNPNEVRLTAPNFVDGKWLLETLADAAEDMDHPCHEHLRTERDERMGCKQCALRATLCERLNNLKLRIKEITTLKSDDHAYWIGKPKGWNARITADNVRLCGGPYYVGDELKKKIFDKFPTAVALSATMTSGGRFDYIQHELGLDQKPANKVKTLRIPSPFDFQRQARFVIPYGIPMPKKQLEKQFNAAAAQAIETLIHDCQGRLLGLFTSKARVKYVYDYLKDRVDYPLFAQGVDFTNKQLAEMFREQTDSVLLATRSFWMGLDVQGEALSCLVVDKLPFDHFFDPFVDMIKAKNPKTFWDSFYVPRAVIALCQGAGRLIRNQNDYGVFVLLDQRLKTMRYGRQFLGSLPFNGYSHDLKDAGLFLQQASRAAGKS